MLGPGALWIPSLGLKFWPQWPFFYGAIVAVLCADVILRFFSLFRWLPRRRFRVVDLALRGVGILIGVLLYLEGPNYVTSSNAAFADWANSTFRVCIAVAIAIHLWRAGWLLFSLLRERHQMLPARQY
jgi:drug/metabolite transporter (DMT)-like permease